MATAPNPRGGKRVSAHTGVRGAPESSPRTGRYQSGYHIDKYELVRPYGEGGMGTVWVAHDLVLDVHCALKLIDVEGSGEEAHATTQRLLDEARAAARLGHPSIIRVFDFGQTEYGDPYIAMELLDGHDLADLMERQSRMLPVDAVALLLPIAHALAAAHDKNIVHRDVKPENIFLANVEQLVVPKLLDFGIARRVDNPRRLTLDGNLLGTPDYMSVEQARGEATGPLTDVWSFCVVLYELIVGRPPFVGENYNALLRAIVEERPKTLTELGIDDAELSGIINHGLEKDPQNRWPSMRDLGETLARWLMAHGFNEDVTGASLRRRWFTDPEGSGRLEISQIANLADLEARLTPPVSHARAITGPQSPPQLPLRSPPQPPPPPIRGGPIHTPGPFPPDEPTTLPTLQAIAELNRGGDPVELIKRSERKRALVVTLILIAIVVAAVAGILFSTGFVEIPL